MENIWLFALTVAIYYFAWCFMTKRVCWKKNINRIALVALLSLPLNIGGNVFTIAGNATAEKSIYSLFSFYQKAENDAMIIIGLAGYQQAKNSAMTIIGLTGYQQAGQEAMIELGLAGYQKAEIWAKVPLAIALYQRVGEKTRAFAAFSELTKD